MNAVLDTQALIWLDAEPAKLSPRVVHYLADPGCTVYLSVVSIWEMVIKIGIGKLTLRNTVRAIVDGQLAANPLTLLPVSYEHVLAVGNLPDIHKDPFDRLLAAQAIVEGAVFLTADTVFAQYPVTVEW
jgi:PIN domain nuclease of toxin-antitoxin system